MIHLIKVEEQEEAVGKKGAKNKMKKKELVER